jgi:hypothetical protein
MIRRLIGLLAALALSVPASRGEEAVKPKDGAKGFAGMIAGKVLSREGGNLAVEVTGIEKTWKHSGMENPQSLVGTTIKVIPSKKAPNVARYAETLKAGDRDVFDVKQDGPSLTMVWLELTKAQRERVGGDARPGVGGDGKKGDAKT